jgi:putative mRNA 3-end processing factor
MPELLTVTDSGLYCERGGFHVDPWVAVERAILTHAHADHAPAGIQQIICSEASAPIVRHRLAEGSVDGVPYRESRVFGDVRVSLHPSGHILGAAQIRLECDGEVWVVSGDYKRQPDPTCEPFEPLFCDVFVTEATFGLPVFRWDPVEQVIGEIFEWWNQNRAAGRASVLFCYSLGKAQRLLAELKRLTDRTVFVHGAIEAICALYRAAGVELLPTEKVVETECRKLVGELVLAPLSARGTPFMRRLGDRQEALASGFMRVRGNRRRRAFDRGFALSDHADWPGLLDTVAQVGARSVRVTHGYAQPLARYLGERGLDARVLPTPARDEQADG